MITGFNTDIDHAGRTYHVQTEDKGLGHPIILSLVYVGGEILASKRTPYEDLVAAGYDEKALTERLQRQHKLICAAIRAGRVEDLKRMSGGNGQQPAAQNKAQARPAAAETGAKPETGREAAREPAAEPPKAEAEIVAPPVTPPPVTPPPPPAPPVEAQSPPTPEDTPVKAGSLLDFITTDLNIPLTPNEFVRREADVPPAPPAEAAPGTDSAEANWIGAGAYSPAYQADDESEDLYLSLLDDEGDFRAGQLATVKILVGRGRFGRRAAPAANVTVKVLGTTFRPMILSTQTDGNGVAVVRALLPQFSSGRAALLIRATDVNGDTAELRRIIHQS